MGRANGDWCILRTGGQRTLKLAESLVGAGFEAWTPTAMVTRRLGRKRDRVERPAPIVPTFVFVRVQGAGSIADLMAAAGAYDSPHPPFSIFRHRGSVPLIADRSLAALRSEEERQQKRRLMQVRRSVEPGTEVSPKTGPWGGMTGIVESSTKKSARVNFGGGFVVTIASYLLVDDVIQSVNKPGLGIAA